MRGAAALATVGDEAHQEREADELDAHGRPHRVPEVGRRSGARLVRRPSAAAAIARDQQDGPTIPPATTPTPGPATRLTPTPMTAAGERRDELAPAGDQADPQPDHGGREDDIEAEP